MPMLNFLRSLFGGGIPSTHKYEAQLNKVEEAYARFTQLDSSEEYLRYLALKEYVALPGHARKLNEIKRLSYKNSPEAMAERRYLKLKKSKEVHAYLKTNEQTDSPAVAEFLRIEEEINSDSFIARKQFLQNKNRHKETEEYKLFEEHKQLSKSDTVTRRDKLKKQNEKTFAEFCSWECAFEDKMGVLPIKEHWSTKPFWGEVLLNQTYAQASELQLPTDGKNLALTDGTLSIVTRKETANGLAWDAKLGFIPKTFSYTSGMLNTSGSFRQQYGRFVAKIKMSDTKHLYHAFWLGSDKMLPHITVCKLIDGYVTSGIYTDSKRLERKKLAHLHDQFYIFELEWNEKSISWLINGKTVYKIPANIGVPLYLGFSSGITDNISEHHLPKNLSIEWVKCYKKKQ